LTFADDVHELNWTKEDSILIENLRCHANAKATKNGIGRLLTSFRIKKKCSRRTFWISIGL